MVAEIIIRGGVIGLGFLLAGLAFRLLKNEFSRDSLRPAALYSAGGFMLFSLAVIGLGLLSEKLRQQALPNDHIDVPSFLKKSVFYKLEAASTGNRHLLFNQSHDFKLKCEDPSKQKLLGYDFFVLTDSGESNFPILISNSPKEGSAEKFLRITNPNEFEIATNLILFCMDTEIHSFGTDLTHNSMDDALANSIEFSK